MELSKRLRLLAELASGGVNIADVGTDHGYIPVWLAERGHRGRIAASDIGEGPLSAARRSASERGVEDRIEFVLADGLSGLTGDFDTFIIAGMGGETIRDILRAAPFSLAGKRLVLQPQTRTEKLMAALYDLNIAVREARLVRDGGRNYAAYLCEGGVKWRQEPAAAELYGLAFLREDPLYPEYAGALRASLEESIRGMERSREPDEDRLRELKELRDSIFS